MQTDARMIVEKCAELGMRLTKQRRAVLQVLGDANDHPTIETIQTRAQLHDPSVSLATVYRILQFLCTHNLALKHDFGSLSTRYELNRWNHHHLVDVESGRIIEFASDSLDRAVRAVSTEFGYDLVDYRFYLVGRARLPLAEQA